MTGRFSGPKLLAAKAANAKFGSDLLDTILTIPASAITPPNTDRVVAGRQVCHQGLEAVIVYVQQLLASGVGPLADLVAHHQQAPVDAATFGGSPIHLLHLGPRYSAVLPSLIAVAAEPLNLSIKLSHNDEIDFQGLQQAHQLGIVKACIGSNTADANVPGYVSDQFENKIQDIVAAGGVARPEPESHPHFGLRQYSDQRVVGWFHAARRVAHSHSFLMAIIMQQAHRIQVQRVTPFMAGQLSCSPCMQAA